MRLSDPKHFDHILPFLQPADVHHSIPVSSADIVRMHAHDHAELGAGQDVGDGCRWQSHCPSIHLCVWLAWALTLFQGAPTSVGSEGPLPAARRHYGKMGTLEPPTAKIKFDGTSKAWPTFKEAMLKKADSPSEGYVYMLEGGHGLCAIFQAASAAAAKKAVGAPATGSDFSLDITTYEDAWIKIELEKTSVLTSVSLALRTNRKDKIGANWADPEKCGMKPKELADAHNVLDAKYLRMVNRALTRTLHDAVFPAGTSETIKFRSILKTPEVLKILAGDALGGEQTWATEPWLMPAMQLWAKLTYRFEDMTDMINGSFMEDLGEILNVVTGPQRKTLYEADQEFEKMTETLVKNFATIKSLMPFLRSSLRQTMIRKLSKVGKDKAAWKKSFLCLRLNSWMTWETRRLSKSSPPRWVSPAVALTSKMPSSIVRSDTSKVPPPRS